MDDIAYFKATYGLRDEDVTLIPYGSRVYGTATPSSDYDYIAIIPKNRRADTGEEYTHNDINIHMYNAWDFQKQLELHKIHALEAFFMPDNPCRAFRFKLDKQTLRHELSAKSSNSWVKAKKKMEVEKDFYIGWKSLFHSMRILDFGIQIASTGRINDYASANHLWNEIKVAGQYDWNYFKDKYVPVYKKLSHEFKRVAPK